MMILGILQARLSSTRLPGKVLRPILGHPMLALQLERVRRSIAIDRLMVATSDQPEDNQVADLCRILGIEVYQGALDDVLDRFYQAALPLRPDHVVRLTGDCPLADPRLIDSVIQFHLNGDYDYSTNAIEATFPDGLDVEVMRFGCLEEAWREAVLPSEREHVTAFIHRRAERYRIAHYKQQTDGSAHRWTVDEPEDFEFVSRIYEVLYPVDDEFTTDDVFALLRARPELLEINKGFLRNEGIIKSLHEHGEFLTGSDEEVQS